MKSECFLLKFFTKFNVFRVIVGMAELTANVNGFRLFIWRSILRLPENHAAYAALVDKGTHPAHALLHEHYPIKSRKLLRVLQRYEPNFSRLKELLTTL